MFFEILLEGASDVPAVKEIMTRRFNLEENTHFRIHQHRGKGNLPENPLAMPDSKHRGLLDQLPAKLRGYSYLPEGYCVIVLVDADSTDCRELKTSLVNIYQTLEKRPRCILFRIAVEETESWFLADREAILKAYPKAKTQKLFNTAPDSIIGAWEHLAEALNFKPAECDGGDKIEWANKISPHLDLTSPKSPSLRAFVNGIEKLIGSSKS